MLHIINDCSVFGAPRRSEGIKMLDHLLSMLGWSPVAAIVMASAGRNQTSHDSSLNTEKRNNSIQRTTNNGLPQNHLKNGSYPHPARLKMVTSKTSNLPDSDIIGYLNMFLEASYNTSMTRIFNITAELGDIQLTFLNHLHVQLHWI